MAKGDKFKIGIDARSISNRICGVSRVTSCLIQALSAIDEVNEYIIYTDSILPSLKLGSNFKISPTYCSRKNPTHDLKFYSILKRDKIKLFHSMHSWLPRFIPKGIKMVVTIHDLFSFTDPDFFIKYKPFHKYFQLYFRYVTGRTLKKADAIVAVSNYCKKEIIKHSPEKDGRVEVISNALGIDGKVFTSKVRLINDDYFLYIGNCRSYKNTGVLIKGFHEFLKKDKHSGLKLVIAGNDCCEGIRAIINELGIGRNIVFLTNPTDQEIANLYAYASAVIMPSKFEGFGIPVLEAMNFGVPVIISNAEALIEVAGDAAAVFERNKPEELALLMEKMIYENTFRKELIEKGYNRASKFTWESSAIKLISLYRKVLNI